MHPDIESILELPIDFADIGFVISTNGMLRQDVNSMLLENEWLVAVSIHGNRQTHNAYVQADAFDIVTTRIRSLADIGVPLHLYSVINDRMTYRDIEWLLEFRDEVSASFLRFITPRSHGRYEPLTNQALAAYTSSVCDERASIVSESSNSPLLNASGNLTRSN